MPDDPNSNVRTLNPQIRTSGTAKLAPKLIERVQRNINPVVVRQLKLERAKIQATINAIINSGQAYPYASVRDWLISRRLAHLTAQHGPLTPETVKGIIASRNDAQASVIQEQAEKLFKLSSWDEWSKTALQAGLIAAGVGGGIGLGIGLAAVGIGAAVGSAVPVFGTLIGAAVGFIVGVATALFPLEKWKVMDNFASLTSKMAPIDRYILWGSCRKVQDNARALEKRSPLPPWWLKTPEFYTIWGGVDSVTVFMFEDLATKDCWPVEGAPDATVPLDMASWDPAAIYALACAASHGAEGEKLVDTKFYQSVGLGTKAMRPYMIAAKDLTCKQIRELAISQKMADFPDIVITDTVLDRIGEREMQLSGGA